MAVLHLVEALLIYTSGASKALPIYTMGRNQQLVGGFVMQSFWAAAAGGAVRSFGAHGDAWSGRYAGKARLVAAAAYGIYRWTNDSADDAHLFYAASFGGFRLQ